MTELSLPTLRDLMRRHTPARVALGPAISTADQLAFQLDHALARDAVHAGLGVRSLLSALSERNLLAIALKSEAEDRQTYLRRPDLGRRLHADSIQTLLAAPAPAFAQPAIVFAIVDGLSALAIERHALPLLDEVLAHLSPDQWQIAPLCVVTQGRVAIADEIGSRLHAAVSVVLIGERPGLSSADSLGAYLTWNPRPGRTDAERNCISNIRAEGLSYAEAAERIVARITAAKRLGATGVTLKEARSLPG